MTHEEVKLICEARKLAKDAGMFVVQKPGRFILYREAKPKNVYEGYRSDLREFIRHIKDVASTSSKVAA